MTGGEPGVTSLSACRLCPRRCGVNRLAGATGFCGAGAGLEVYRSAPHHGEEPPVSGTRGSGTVFFGRCTLRCRYCQNHPWSQEGQAAPCSAEELAGRLTALARAGCHNWNWVSPTPWLPRIREAVRAAKADGFSLPLVYNTSGFERVETLAEYSDLADVYLTDLRYSREESAGEGSGFAGYVAASREALLWMWRRAGPLDLDGDGIARSGTICRLLVLPGRADEAVENLEWLARSVGTDIAVSVMAQYTPAYRARWEAVPPWNRAITAAEYERVCAAVQELGFDSGWVQDLAAETPGELVGYRMKAE